MDKVLVHRGSPGNLNEDNCSEFEDSSLDSKGKPSMSIDIHQVVREATSQEEDALNTFEAKIQRIIQVGSGQWDRDTVFRALTAANQSTEHAIDILSLGSFELIDSIGCPETPKKDNCSEFEDSSLDSKGKPSMSIDIHQVVREATSQEEDALNTFEAKIQRIIQVGSGQWDRDTVFRALTAANQSTEHAIDILSLGSFELIDSIGCPETPKKDNCSEFEDSSLDSKGKPSMSIDIHQVVREATSQEEDALNTFEAKIQRIIQVGSGQWDRDTVFRALTAANQSTEHAIDILSLGSFELIDSIGCPETPKKRRDRIILEGVQVVLPSVPRERTPPRDFSNKTKGRIHPSPWDPPKQKPAKATVPAAPAPADADADAEKELELIAKDEEAVHVKLNALRASKETSPELGKVIRSLAFLGKVRMSFKESSERK